MPQCYKLVFQDIELLKGGGRFCRGCGQVITFDQEWKDICPNCYRNEEKLKYCTECGTDIPIRDFGKFRRCYFCEKGLTEKCWCGTKHPEFWKYAADHPRPSEDFREGNLQDNK